MCRRYTFTACRRPRLTGERHNFQSTGHDRNSEVVYAQSNGSSPVYYDTTAAGARQQRQQTTTTSCRTATNGRNNYCSAAARRHHKVPSQLACPTSTSSSAIVNHYSVYRVAPKLSHDQIIKKVVKNRIKACQ